MLWRLDHGAYRWQKQSRTWNRKTHLLMMLKEKLELSIDLCLNWVNLDLLLGCYWETGKTYAHRDTYDRFIIWHHIYCWGTGPEWDCMMSQGAKISHIDVLTILQLWGNVILPIFKEFRMWVCYYRSGKLKQKWSRYSNAPKAFRQLKMFVHLLLVVNRISSRANRLTTKKAMNV